MLQQQAVPAPCPHCTPDSPPVSYANGSFCSDIQLLAAAFALPFESPTLVGVSHASRLVCSAAGAFTLSSPRRPEPSWWLVRSGSARLGRRDADGRFVERRRVGPGDWFDVSGAMAAPARWAEDAVVDETLELLALSHASLTDACRSDAAFARALQQVLRHRLGELSQRTTGDAAAGPLEPELARQLAQLGATGACS